MSWLRRRREPEVDIVAVLAEVDARDITAEVAHENFLLEQLRRQDVDAEWWMTTNWGDAT